MVSGRFLRLKMEEAGRDKDAWFAASSEAPDVDRIQNVVLWQGGLSSKGGGSHVQQAASSRVGSPCAARPHTALVPLIVRLHVLDPNVLTYCVSCLVIALCCVASYPSYLCCVRGIGSPSNWKCLALGSINILTVRTAIYCFTFF